MWDRSAPPAQDLNSGNLFDVASAPGQRPCFIAITNLLRAKFAWTRPRRADPDKESMRSCTDVEAVASC